MANSLTRIVPGQLIHKPFFTMSLTLARLLNFSGCKALAHLLNFNGLKALAHLLNPALKVYVTRITDMMPCPESASPTAPRLYCNGLMRPLMLPFRPGCPFLDAEGGSPETSMLVSTCIFRQGHFQVHTKGMPTSILACVYQACTQAT